MGIGEIIYTILIQPLALIFEFIFSLSYRATQSPGISIIILSIAINILVYPLYKRADYFQKEEIETEKKLHNGVAQIKKMFSGDEQMMILRAYYRENGYKPLYALRGAVPLLLQIPFFIAAYTFLSNLELLQGVSFGPIANLGQPDGLLRFGNLTVNLLPILMTAINLISSAIYSKGMPSKTKIQLYAMAAVFLILLYPSPAGLVFYWTLNNLFSLIKTLISKLKNPQKIVRIVLALLGVFLIVLSIYANYINRISFKVEWFIIIVGAVLQLPWLWNYIKTRRTFKPVNINWSYNTKIL